MSPPFEGPDSRAEQKPSEVSEAVEELRQKAELPLLLDLAREAIFVLNNERKIVLLNQAAERLYGWSRSEALGKTPTDLLKTELPRPIAQIENILRHEGRWDYELKQTTREGKQLTVASRWALWRDSRGRCLGRFQLDTDITRRKQAEQELRILTGRLLNLRDEERRRMARDLHDSVGQWLSLAILNLRLVQQQLKVTEPAALKLFSECRGLIDQGLQEIRTMSYLLHPPLLDEIGLQSALPWFVSGFMERSQIRVDLEVPKDLGRFPRELEIAIFRIVQETLSNVHRHSGSSTAKITVTKLPNQVRLKVEDQGKGMGLPLAGLETGGGVIPGVGISGIRERVRQLRGHMQIRSASGEGTTLEVIFPLEEFATSKHGPEGCESVAD